ncbi:MAG: hypothetical protein E7465_03175 [Ruminococcaceae bacterium]|nr:hypothetical protein [Oscillospiraceae bacterium]
MNTFKGIKRVISLVLVLIMVAAMMPVNAHAATAGRESDTIFFATDRHEESSKLQSLLRALQYTPGLVVLGGDHVNDKNSGSLASITSEIQSVYPGVQTFYTYAAHDPNVSADSSNPYAYARTGEYYEGEDYYVYALDQDAMQSASTAATASANFKSWAAAADSSKVIFVMCHMPIHSRRGDNAGGATWMSALNEVGQSHDIVYLWGHNHTGENSTDTSVYFVGVGGSLTPQGGSTGTINFTYMNAGYIKNGYASMVVINNDTVDVTRYNTSGSATANYSIERRFATSHTWEVTESVAATCETDGYETLVCTDCGETKTTVIPATGHNYSSVVQNTCTGSCTIYTCSACGHSYTEQNATETTYDQASGLTEGESYVIVASNYALTYGSSVGRTSVSVSNGSITSDVTDAMIWTYTGGKLYNEANGKYLTASSGRISFGSSGSSVSYSSNRLKIGNYYLRYSSSAFSASRTSGSTVSLYQVNEAVGGTGEHIYETVTVEATCTENGYTGNTCTLCGDTTITDETPALGHSYESVTVEATCTEDGYTTHTCAACGDSYVTDEVAALGHVTESVITDPTCDTEGYTTHTCTVCGEVTVDSIVEALGHDYVTRTVTLTCTEDGFSEHTCTVCGYSYISDFVEAAGHDYTVTVENGYNVYTCVNCGDSYSDEVVVTYNRVNVITDDNNYVVALYLSGKYYALSHADNTLSLVEIQRESSWITSEVTEDLLWHYENKKLSYESEGKTYYLYSAGFNKALTVSTSRYSNVTFSSSKLKIGNYYLRYNNGKIVTARSYSTTYMYVEG